MKTNEAPLPRRSHRWPWFALAAVVLGVVLAVLWVGVAARRLRDMREPRSSPGDPRPAAPARNG